MSEPKNDRVTGRNDPLPAFCFAVQLPGFAKEPVGFFKSVGGLKAETEVVDFREGGVNHTTIRLVGATKWPNLVLKRGFTGPPYTLLQWRWSWLYEGIHPEKKKGVKPTEAVPRSRQNGRIIQLDTALRRVCSWTFVNAWPCKWEGPDYDAGKNELAIETIELAHEGLEFEGADGTRIDLPFTNPRHGVRSLPPGFTGSGKLPSK